VPVAFETDFSHCRGPENILLSSSIMEASVFKTRLVLLLTIVVLTQISQAQTPQRARIQPLPVSEWTDAHKQALGSMAQGDRTIDVFKTCLRNLELCRNWMPFTQYVLGTTNSVPRRERELVILRTSWDCDADYDWAHHVPAAQRAGLSDEEILRISKGPSAAGWSRSDALLLQATDELHRDQRITEATWRSLAEHYNEQQMMDLVFTVGQYTMVSLFLNSAQVQLEPGLKGLPR
jgi:alkylhydroperoxidase family enzyme